MSLRDWAKQILLEIKYYKIPTLAKLTDVPEYQFIIHRRPLEVYTDDDEPEVIHGIIHVDITYEPYNAEMWKKGDE